jgi:hypothetical protein
MEYHAKIRLQTWRSKLLKGQDIAVVAKLLSLPSADVEQSWLASELCLSQSEISKSMRRLHQAQLINSSTREVYRANYFELVVHGLRYFYPAVIRSIGAGIPTAWGDSKVFDNISSSECPVWLHISGKTRGPILDPLYDGLPEAALKDEAFYHTMAAVDGIRMGRTREIAQAVRFLKRQMKL